MVKPGNRSSLVSLHCPCPHHRAPLQEDLPRLLTAHLTHSALPGLPCLLEETSRSSRQLSELPGSGELDVRQIHCLVLSEPWQRRENRRESGGQNQTMHEPCQHCGQARPMMVTSAIHTPHSSPSHQPASQPGKSGCYLRCPRLWQMRIPRAGFQPSWQTRSQSGRALTCTSSRRSSPMILKDTETTA